MKITVQQKLCFPKKARLRNFSYSSAMTVDLNIKYIVCNGENYKNVLNYQKRLRMFILENSQLC